MHVWQRLLVGGEWVDPATGSTCDVICPSTEELVGRVPEAQPADMDRGVSAARRAFDDGDWPNRSPKERAEVLSDLAKAIAGRADEITRLITTEMGVAISSARADHVDQPIRTIEYYVSLAGNYPFEQMRTVDRSTRVVQEPVGVVAAIVPWNAPLRSIVNKLAPALLAGCTAVVKPAPSTPLAAMVLAEIVAALDVPPGVVSILPGDRDAGEHLVSHRDVDKIAFTGSTAAGRRIMAAAAPNLTRVGLELGGKSAAIVLDDADIANTLRRLLPMAIGNSGQACTAQSRVLVPSTMYGAFVDALCEALSAWPCGDPFDPATRTGPLASRAQLDRVLAYLDLALTEGCTVACGGGRPNGFDRGYYLDPTVLTNVTNDMRVAREEIFGPVIAVLAYEDVDEAVRIANDSDYGLSGSVWTGDTERGVEIARRVRTGQVRVNGAAPATDAPFGGFKHSGIGREYGPEGLAAFLEPKAIAYRRDR